MRKEIRRVKTGCMTCKIRRVKCDEAKPSCQRCISTGRVCDGYSPMPSRSSTPSRTAITWVKSGPSISNWLSTDEEKKGFQYFQERACGDLGGNFHLPFWSRQVLQAAVAYPSVRHLVVALGSIYQSFEAQESDPAERHARTERMNFALRQCNRSIPHLTELLGKASTGKQSMEASHCILTASVLLTYLSTLQGHMGHAIDHARSGLRILQSIEASETEDTSSNFPIPLSQLRSLLTSLYGQARSMINDETLAILTDNWKWDPLITDFEPVTCFVTVEEAHEYVESLFYNNLAFLQGSELFPPTSQVLIQAAMTRHAELCRGLESSREALTSLEQRLTPEDAAQWEGSINILWAFIGLLEIRLNLDFLRPELRESKYDELEDNLTKILGHCRTAVQSRTASSRQRSCHSGLGVVMPLHTVAARCRNPKVRKEAVELLRTCDRRDGIWDGKLAGHVASKMIEIEEAQNALAKEKGSSFTEDDRADGRVREVQIAFQGERKASITFVTVGNWRRKENGIQHLLEW